MISYKVLYFAMFLFPMPIFRIGSITIATMLLALYVLLFLVSKKKIALDRMGSSFLLVSVITLFSALISSMGNTWKIHAVSQFAQYVLILLFYFIAKKSFGEKEIGVAISGLKASCIANIILCFIQAVSWYALRLDVNDIVFNQLLHLQEDASKMRFGHVSVSGFGWHPAQLIPVLVLSYFLFDSFPVRISIVIIGLLTGNFTCTLAVLLCVIFSLLNSFISKRRKSKFKKRTIVLGGIALLGVIVIILINAEVISGAIDNAFLNFNRIQYAISGNYDSGSTMKHSRYYLGYPQVVSSSTFLQDLFGYGIDCSGYPYSRLFAQYADKSSWHVESDYINILVGRGWLWAFMFYYFLASIMAKGKKISYKYVLSILVMLIAGLFYDCQGRWTMCWEILMYIAIIRKVDVWKLQTKRSYRNTEFIERQRIENTE